MAHHWQPVLGILSALLFFSLAVEMDQRPSLSVVTMLPLLQLEKKLIDNLDDYANALDHKLQLLRSHILDMRVENEKAQLDPVHYVSNPLNGFSLIRRLHKDWVGWRKFMGQSVGLAQMQKMKAWWRELPTEYDLREACDGIVRIQNVHNLEVSDIIRGKLKGKEYNVSMSPSDIFAVGDFVSRSSIFDAAVQWLMRLPPVMLEDLVSHQDHIFNPSKEAIRRLIAMHVNEGYFSVALYLINFWLQHFPHNAYYERSRLALEKHMLQHPDAPYERAIDLVTVPELQWLRACCSNTLKSRPTDRLHCSYNSSTTPFLRLAPFKMEQIGLDPYVVLYHDVLSPQEISQLQKLALDRLITCRTGGKKRKNRRVRSCKVFTVGREYSRLTKRIKRRIEDISGLDLEGSEKLALVNYGIGGHFDVHVDFHDFPDLYETKQSGNRIATVLFYLSDVEQGGETVFPDAGYAIRPRAGTALFWYNLHTDGIGDIATTHGACPVIVGSKWVMTQWILERKQLFKRPCLRPSPKNVSEQWNWD